MRTKRFYSARDRGGKAGLDSIRYRRIDKRKSLKAPLKRLQDELAQLQFPLAFIVNPDLKIINPDGTELVFQGSVCIIQCAQVSGVLHTTKDLAKQVLGFFYSEGDAPVTIDIASPGILIGVVRKPPKRSKSGVNTPPVRIELGQAHYELSDEEISI
jgi:hypothetical protein